MAVDNNQKVEVVRKIFGKQNIYMVDDSDLLQLKDLSVLSYIESKYEIADLIDALIDEIKNIEDTFCEEPASIIIYNHNIRHVEVRYSNFSEVLDAIKTQCNAYISLGGKHIFNRSIEALHISNVQICSSSYDDHFNNTFANARKKCINIIKHDPEVKKHWDVNNSITDTKYTWMQNGLPMDTFGEIIDLLPYTSSFGSVRTCWCLPLILVAIAPTNELALHLMQMYKDNLEECFINSINDEDKKNSIKRDTAAAGGIGYWTINAKTANLNYDWIKASQVIDKSYDLELLKKKQSEFDITFKSIDDYQLHVTGTVKARPISGNPENGWNVTIKPELCQYFTTERVWGHSELPEWHDIVKWHKHGGAVQAKIVEKLKEYFKEIIQNENGEQ